MNRGVAVGKLLSADSDTPAGGATVALTRIVGNDGLEIGFGALKGDKRRRQYVETTANSKGEFVIVFQWSGADIGSAMLYNTLTLSAYTEITTRNSFMWTSHGRVNTRGYLFDDSPRRILQAIPGGEQADLADFANLLSSGIGGLPSLPTFSPDEWSSESKIILAGTYVQLRS